MEFAVSHVPDGLETSVRQLRLTYDLIFPIFPLSLLAPFQLKYETMTLIQEQAIPVALSARMSLVPPRRAPANRWLFAAAFRSAHDEARPADLTPVFNLRRALVLLLHA
jgi:hypothetical protein